MRQIVSIALLLVAGATGCATTANGSAPAGNNQLLVVGSRNNLPQAWLCPATGTAAPCRMIDVKEVEK